MRMRAIPKQLLKQDMLVKPLLPDGTFGESRLVRHVLLQLAGSVVYDEHRSGDMGAGKVFVDATNSEGAFDVPPGSRIVGTAPPDLVELGAPQALSYVAKKVQKFRVLRGVVHHWEIEVE